MSAMNHAADRLYAAMDEKKTPLCVGLDPNLRLFPKCVLEEASAKYGGDSFRAAGEAIRMFNMAVIEAVHDLVPVSKPQSAYYEPYGSEGIRALEDTVRHLESRGVIPILDAKRNDIGRTSQAYADAYLGESFMPDGSTVRSPVGVQFLTVVGYLGSDGVKPFVETARDHNNGLFVLAKTSNKSAGDLQDLKLESGIEVYMQMAALVDQWCGDDRGEEGYSHVGMVVGATKPEEAALLREKYPHLTFLMPGYGTQGAAAEKLINGFDARGRGAVVNSSSGINYAFSNPKFAERHPELAKDDLFADAARQATIDSIEDINAALKGAGKLPAGW